MSRPVADYIPLRRAAELAGLDRRQLRQMAARGLIQTSVLPGSVQRHRLYRRQDCLKLRETIERGFTQGAR